jgi:hypothetical protein
VDSPCVAKAPLPLNVGCDARTDVFFLHVHRAQTKRPSGNDHAWRRRRRAAARVRTEEPRYGSHARVLRTSSGEECFGSIMKMLVYLYERKSGNSEIDQQMEDNIVTLEQLHVVRRQTTCQFR